MSWNDSYKRRSGAGDGSEWNESKFLWLRHNFERGNFLQSFCPKLIVHVDFVEVDFTHHLIGLGLLPNRRTCEKCGNPMTICNHDGKTHGCEWKCLSLVRKGHRKAKLCGSVVSICKDSWFGRTKLTKMEVLEFIYKWWKR